MEFNVTVSDTTDPQLSPLSTYVLLMSSLVVTLIVIIGFANLLYRCYVRCRNRIIDARMAAIARETTTREDDIDDDMREPEKIAVVDSEDDDICDMETGCSTNASRRKRRTKKKKKSEAQSLTQ
jgi:hypothetical protein